MVIYKMDKYETFSETMEANAAALNGGISKIALENILKEYIATSPTTTNGVLTGGPLTLTADPTTPLQAATKQYVDSGDLTLQTQVTTLQGTVGTLNANPVTLSYVDTQDTLKVNKAGDTMTGPLVLPGSPTLVTHATDKGYVDTLVTTHTTDVVLHLTPDQNTLLDTVTVTSTEINTLAGATSNIQTQINTNAVNLQTQINNITSTVTTVPTGTVIEVDTATTPTNYLRANGTQISKTTYAALFAVIGDTYATTTMSSIIGQPWRQQYSFNMANSTIGTWVTDTPLPFAIYASQVIVTNNRVYLLGGRINGVDSAIVYTTIINPDGTLGAWVTSTPLPNNIKMSQAIVTNNRVYLIGGNFYKSGASIVYTATINPDGTLGAWVIDTPLPVVISHSQAVVTSNRVYLLGGHINNTQSNAIYTAPINTDGTLGTWVADISIIPNAIYNSQAIVTNNRVYLIGGFNKTVYFSTVYTAPINPDGTLGGWVVDTPLPETIAISQAIVTNNRVYLIGGRINNILSSTIYTAPINADGTLGTWVTDIPLPIALNWSQAIVTNNRVYLLGGITTDLYGLNTVYSAPFSGGLNNYLNPVSVNATTFTLPDYTIIDAVSSPKTYHYIKF